MATSFKTPGVYVREFAREATVEATETAIPAFIGYTEIHVATPTLVDSMEEFELQFGGGTDEFQEIHLDANDQVKQVVHRFYLHAALGAYFANGGGECYIVSVGAYSTVSTPPNPITTTFRDAIETALSEGVDKVEDESAVTMLVVPDALMLNDSTVIGNLYQKMLKQCADSPNRFALLDTVQTDSVTEDAAGLRNALGTQNLMYGAAYVPHLNTTRDTIVGYGQIVGKLYTDVGGTTDVSTISSTGVAELTTIREDIDHIKGALADPATGFSNYTSWFESFTTEGTAAAQGRATVIKDMATEILRLVISNPIDNDLVVNTELKKYIEVRTKVGGVLYEQVRTLMSYDKGWSTLSILGNNDFNSASLPFGQGSAGDEYDYELNTVLADNSIYYGETVAADKSTVSKQHYLDVFVAVFELFEDIRAKALEIAAELETNLEATNSAYKTIVDGVRERATAVPASAVAAGKMVKKDREFGVWQAPANEELVDVYAPVLGITHADQEGLNVDATSGKSINAIREFAGKGVRIWGARTLAGNSGEWRYIPVRRFYSSVEKDLSKTLGAVVFEPNNAITWLRVKSIADRYLNKLWRAGALQGAAPDEAYFVQVGLGETMTSEDVLNGQLIVHIGLAAQRPAEFISLRFVYRVDS